MWPLRVTYVRQKSAVSGQPSGVLIWAPKSLHKHAIERNRLRRQMREAWRLNKSELEGAYMLALNYIDKSMQPYTVIERAVKKAIKRLNEETDS